MLDSSLYSLEEIDIIRQNCLMKGCYMKYKKILNSVGVTFDTK